MKRNVSKENQPYHVLSRATEGRSIFRNKEDAYRFLFQMYTTNYGSPALNLYRRGVNKAVEELLAGREIPETLFVKKHEPLVHCLSFAQVVNHYHFLLLPNTENGISVYMQKLNTAFAKYFNLKHSRTGILFEGRYKSIAIETEAQLDAIIRYINVKNPLDVYQPGWREEGLKNKKEGWSFLLEYPFSSFPDIFGERNSKFLAPEPIRSQFLDRESIYGKKSYEEFLKQPFHRENNFQEIVLDEYV